MLDFPAPPLTPGTVWTGTNGTNYVWNGSYWVLQPGTGGPFLPLSGGTVTGPTMIAPSGVMSGATWTPAFFVQTSLSGVSTVNNISNFHQVTINSDTLDASGTALKLVNYSAVNANLGGAGMKGNRQGFDAAINLSAASGNPGGGAYVGIVGAASASAPDNGTGLTPFTCGGALFGANFYANTGGTAQNFGGVVGVEINPAIGTGTTCVSLTGIQVVPTSQHAVRGAIGWDIGYLLASQPGAQGLDVGYCVGSANGGAQWPIRSDGALFRGAMGYSGGASAYHGILLNEVSFPAFGGSVRGGAFVSNLFAVDGNGSIQCGAGYIQPSGGLTIDVKGSIGTGTPTVAAGGSGYAVNDVLYDPYGGVYIVSAVTSGAVTAVTVRTGAYGETHQPSYSSHTTPANPVATSTWSNSHGGAGCTLNISWNTSLTGLQLQPSGGSTTFGGPVTENLAKVYTLANQVNPLFFSTSAISGTLSGSTYYYSPFHWQIPSNSIDASASNGFWGAQFTQNFGGTKGGQGALNVAMTQTASVLDTSGVFVTGLNAYLDIEYAGNNVGNAVAFSPLINFGPGASGWASTAAEIGIARAAGSSVLKAIIANLTYSNLATTHASQLETAICFSGTPGDATGLNSLMSIGHGITQWVLDQTNGWIFTTAPQTNNNPGNTQRWPQACSGGLDFSKINFSAAALRAPGGLSIGGSTLAQLGPAYLSVDGNGLVLDVTGYVGFVSGITAGGAGYQVNDQLYDGLGGIALVTGIGAGGSVTAVSYIAGKEPYNNAGGSATVTASGGSGSGATFTTTWAQRQQLALNKSGAPTTVGGALTIAGATVFSGATNCTVTSGSAAPAATQPAGSIYMRTGGASGARLYVSAGAGAWNAVAGV